MARSRTLSGRARLAGMVMAAMPLGGCIAVGGTSNAAPHATAGQELVDLKRAADAGAISHDEYESMRQQIIKGRCSDSH